MKDIVKNEKHIIAKTGGCDKGGWIGHGTTDKGTTDCIDKSTI